MKMESANIAVIGRMRGVARTRKKPKSTLDMEINNIPQRKMLVQCVNIAIINFLGIKHAKRNKSKPIWKQKAAG